jgi:hypothetical protein
MSRCHRVSDIIVGSVARVEDPSTLIINRGSSHGVTVGMEFAVMADEGDPIVDPETNEVIGDLPTEKLRVRVFDVHEKYARAETFREYQPPPSALPSLASALQGPNYPGMRELAGFKDALGADFAKQFLKSEAFESSSMGSLLRYQMENPRPVRQQIANANRNAPVQAPLRREVTVNIGDKVRQIVPNPPRLNHEGR